MRSASDCIRIALDEGSLDKRIEENAEWAAKKLSAISPISAVRVTEESSKVAVNLIEIVRRGTPAI